MSDNIIAKKLIALQKYMDEELEKIFNESFHPEIPDTYNPTERCPTGSGHGEGIGVINVKCASSAERPK